jgi:hypothetical protein
VKSEGGQFEMGWDKECCQRNLECTMQCENFRDYTKKDRKQTDSGKNVFIRASKKFDGLQVTETLNREI